MIVFVPLLAWILISLYSRLFRKMFDTNWKIGKNPKIFLNRAFVQRRFAYFAGGN